MTTGTATTQKVVASLVPVHKKQGNGKRFRENYWARKRDRAWQERLAAPSLFANPRGRNEVHLGLRSRLKQWRNHLPAEHHAGAHVGEEHVPEPHGVVVAQQLEHLLHVRHRRQLLETHSCVVQSVSAKRLVNISDGSWVQRDPARLFALWRASSRDTAGRLEHVATGRAAARF